jgi:hypothetical protein
LTLNLPLSIGYENPGFTITMLHKCVLVSALPGQCGVPIEGMQFAVKMVPAKAVMDCDLARIYGAIFVAGLPKDLKVLHGASITTEMRRAYVAPLLKSKLSDQEINWLMFGEYGGSAAAIFKQISDIDPPTLRGGGERDKTMHPSDISDFRRCQLLLETVPEYAKKFAEMRQVSPVWNALVDAWPGILYALEADCPKWRETLKHTENAQSLLETTLRSAEAKSVMVAS